MKYKSPLILAREYYDDKKFQNKLKDIKPTKFVDF